MKKNNTYRIEIIIAIIAFFASILGAIIGGYFSNSLWEKDKLFTIRQKTIDKRLELYEKTVKIINKKNEAELIQTKFELLGKIIDTRLKYYQNNSTKEELRNKDIFAKDELMEDALKSKIEVFDISNEFAIILSLDSVFFGDNTRNAIGELKKTNPWWKASDAQYIKLLDAMYSEIYIDVKK